MRDFRHSGQCTKHRKRFRTRRNGAKRQCHRGRSDPKPDAKAKTVSACHHISNDKEGYEVWQFKDGDFVKVSERVEELRD
ncbi:MAG: hypothetical protein J6I34_10470 [Prevotella sp.]|nr:hypothetical protein [Prevotella sp.]